MRASYYRRDWYNQSPIKYTYFFVRTGDCDFEADYCTWTNDVTADDFDWIRKQGAINSGGPPTDHTIGSSAGMWIYRVAEGLIFI